MSNTEINVEQVDRGKSILIKDQKKTTGVDPLKNNSSLSIHSSKKQANPEKASAKQSVKKDGSRRSSINIKDSGAFLEIKPLKARKQRSTSRRILSNQCSKEIIEPFQTKVNNLDLLGGLDFFLQSRDAKGKSSMKQERQSRSRLKSSDSLTNIKSKRRRTSARPVIKPRTKKDLEEYKQTVSANPCLDSASAMTKRDHSSAKRYLELDNKTLSTKKSADAQNSDLDLHAKQNMIINIARVQSINNTPEQPETSPVKKTNTFISNKSRKSQRSKRSNKSKESKRTARSKRSNKSKESRRTARSKRSAKIQSPAKSANKKHQKPKQTNSNLQDFLGTPRQSVNSSQTNKTGQKESTRDIPKNTKLNIDNLQGSESKSSKTSIRVKVDVSKMLPEKDVEDKREISNMPQVSPEEAKQGMRSEESEAQNQKQAQETPFNSVPIIVDLVAKSTSVSPLQPQQVKFDQNEQVQKQATETETKQVIIAEPNKARTQTFDSSSPKIGLKGQVSKTQGTGSDFSSDQDTDEYEIVDGERTKKSKQRRKTKAVDEFPS